MVANVYIYICYYIHFKYIVYSKAIKILDLSTKTYTSS